ncbi:MAG TPA: YigZ family protein [Flavobacteriales bacterium]|nr:YigZ family protein [Flavobacteriales bacterium]HIK62833.1 YigZ family protein [Flavobacteriales bacterium]
MFNDTYKEIKSHTTGIYKEKGSKFIAYSYPVYSEQDVKDKLEEVRKLEHSARHHCYAYILNPDKSAQRANDDGEPSSTAGKPILGQILSNNLTNILIVVVRYFGGVKLGVPGLIRSYKTAAAAAIANATILSKKIKEHYEVSFKYPQMNDVMRLVKEYDLEVVNTDFQIDCKLIFAAPKSKANDIVDTFKKNHELSIKYVKTI